MLLPRILNDKDEASFDKLERLAIKFSYPNLTQVNPKLFEVRFTYYDVDNDCVVIATDEELQDAVSQFWHLPNPVLRVTTDVKRVTGRHSLNFVKAEQDAATKKAVDVQHLTESLISTLARTTSVVQSRGPNTSRRFSREARAANLAGLSPEQARDVNATAEKLVREVVGNIGLTVDAPASSEVEPKPEEPAAAAAPSAAPEEVEPTVDSNEKMTNTPEPEEESTFIHGRHTCDACLTTPIVGLRYHATNLPDYDLCAKCRPNYKGNEIQFEAVELGKLTILVCSDERQNVPTDMLFLERDRPFQERWRRKRLRWAQRNARGPRSGPRGENRGGHHDRPNRGMGGPPPHCRRRNWGPGPAVAHAAGTTDLMDDALREAIRRSLQDVTIQPTVQPQAEPRAPDAAVSPSPVATAAVTVPTPVVEVQRRPEPNIFATVAVSASAVESVSGETADVTETASDASQPALKSPPVVDVTPEKMLGEAASAKLPDEDEKESLIEDEKDVVDAEENKKVAAVGEVLETPQRIVTSPVKPSPTVSFFSEDADGNGSVARVLGQTLDQCATAIDAMMDEIHRGKFDSDTMSVDTDIKPEVVKSERDVLVETVTEESTGDESESGASIMDGEDEESEVASQKSDDGWHVVNEKEQIAGDETLARAAQLVGSALFESDMKSSDSNMASSVASFPSSVPTLTSEISPLVLDRWAGHLTMLKELGFGDDAKSVEIMERLSAANIGVDSNDEITVTQVVNELLKN